MIDAASFVLGSVRRGLEGSREFDRLANRHVGIEDFLPMTQSHQRKTVITFSMVK